MMPTQCQMKPDYINPCGSDAAYVVYGEGCHACTRRRTRTECVGHTVCEEHAAALRMTDMAEYRYRESGESGDAFRIQRLHTLGATA